MKKKPTNSQEKPLVSIITPSYNAASFILHTLQSVRDQTYSHWEHIIVDDASSDTTPNVLQQWAEEDPRVRIELLKENQGAAYCRNRATELAQGDYIAFLDSDDLWHPEKLQRQVAFMQAQDCSVCFSSYVHIDEQGQELGTRINALPILSYQKQLRNNYIGNLTGIYSAKKLGKIMAPSIRKRQDWAVWLEAIRLQGKPAVGLSEVLAYYRVRSGSISSNKWKLIKYNFQFYRKFLGQSWPVAVINLLRFFWEYFVHRPKLIEKL